MGLSFYDVTKNQLRVQHQYNDAEFSYLLILVVFTVSTWWSTTETRGVISLDEAFISSDSVSRHEP